MLESATQGRHSKRRYIALDALRGVAALMVALMHISSRWHPKLAPSAHLAVDFFFILSGFVVAEAYDARLKGSMSFGEFARARIIRLWPMIVLGVLLAGTYAVARGQATGNLAAALTGVVLGLFMLPSPPQFSEVGALYSVNAPAWSLLAEIVANLAYAAVAVWLTTRNLVLLVAIAAVVLVATSLGHPDLNIGWGWDDPMAGFVRVAFGFSMGLLLQRLPRLPIVTSSPLMMGAGLLLAGILALPPLGVASELAIVILIFPPLVWATASLEAGMALGKIPERMGALSYPLYMVHASVALWGVFLLRRTPATGLPSWLVCISLLAVAVALAALAERSWDIPIRRYLTQWGRGREAAPLRA